MDSLFSLLAEASKSRSMQLMIAVGKDNTYQVMTDKDVLLPYSSLDEVCNFLRGHA